MLLIPRRTLPVVWYVLGAAALAAEMRGPLATFFIEDAPGRFVAESAGVHAVFSKDGVQYRSGGTQASRIDLRFLAARENVELTGREPGGRANFLVGRDPRAWRTGLPTYREIVYRELYPGIDLAYLDAGGRLKSEFHVAPGADPGRIAMEYSTDLSIDADGCLHAGILREQAPAIYQETSAGRTTVKGRYRLLGARTAAFEIFAYDTAWELVIDPVISYSTYLGGTGLGAVTAVAVDAGGNLYATGWTEALNFPTAGAAQATNLGGVDAFVVKVNPTGGALIYATYIGGIGEDKGTGIAVDASGQAHVTGSTASSNFPLAAPMQTLMGGAKTAFVLKLNAVGNALLFSTYLGGGTYDTGTAVAVDAAGNTYVAGDTQSSNFPVLHAPQATLGGSTDAFVAALSPAGTLFYGTYLGGAGVEHAGGIAVDSTGNMYVTGGTYSTNFPIKAGAVQGVNGGNQDAFVTKLAAAGLTVVYSTFLGGNGPATPEQGNGIAVDAGGNAYVTGVANSANFPVTTGAYQPLFNGVSDAFVSKLNAAGSALIYSTFLGGTNFDWANGIAVDGGGNAFVAGYTSSGDFPVVNALQPALAGFYDAFVSKIGAAGNALGFSTYWGGSGADAAGAIAVDASGNMFVGGQTGSVNLPLTVPLQSANSGGSIGWLARLGVTAPPLQVPSVTSVTPSSGSGYAAVFTASYADTGGGAALASASLLLGASAATANSCYVTYNRASNVFTLANDDPAAGSQTVVPGGGTVQNSQCTLIGAGSTATTAGNTLTATISLAFLPGFVGSKTVYLFAADAGANSGWVSQGAWTVSIPPPQPSVGTASPNANSGASQTFSLVFSDSLSADNLTNLGILLASSVTFNNKCYLLIDPHAGTVALARDNPLASDSRLLSSATPLQNSQCLVGATSIAVSGLSEIVTLTLTFKPAFAGPQNIYLLAASGALTTGWVQRGTFTVAVGGTPVANSVVPGSGSGPGQRFSFTVSDAGGMSFLTGLQVLFAPSLNNVNACLLVFDRNANSVSLSYEDPANGATPLTPGANVVVANNQCTISGANTTVVFGTTSMVVTLDLRFSSSWFGPKNIYLLASESSTLNTGWVQVGTWVVTGGAPTADSVSPSPGSGSSPVFTFTVSDSSLQSNISGIAALITTGAPTNLTSACYLIYTRGNTTNSTIGLYDNNAAVLANKGLGSSTTMQNSQCAVGYTAVTTSGNSVMLQVQLVFGNFSGPKTIYLQAVEPGANSGWVQRGTWTVP